MNGFEFDSKYDPFCLLCKKENQKNSKENEKNEIMYYKEMSDLKCANSLYSWWLKDRIITS